VLEKLIVRVIMAYPHQAMWWMAPIAKSTNRTRSQRALRMIQQAAGVAGRGSVVEQLGRQMLALAEELARLANEPTDKNVNPPPPLSLSNYFERLSRMTHLEVMVPLQRLMLARLPQGPASVGSGHNPVPDAMATIVRSEEEVMVMGSLQRPKRVTMLGSDGRKYHFLAKPNDDLRNDARLMEFNSMINSLLSRDDEANERGMSKYSCFP
jgi:serine/threonine-protein kinase ATR